MWFFYAVALPLVLVLIGAGLLIMPAKRSVSWAVRADVGLAWFAALSTLILVPTDIANALQENKPKLLSIWWRIAYWYGFVAQFTVLPFHQEFADSGAFSWTDRVVSSLRNNLVFYAVLAGAGAMGLIVLLVSGELAPTNVLGFCIATSNAVGLLGGLFLLGYGLIAIPKQLWRTASVKGEERALHHRAGVQSIKAIAARQELAKTLALAEMVSGTFSRRDPMRRYMDKITAMAAASGEDVRAGGEVREDVDYLDKTDLGGLRRRLRRAIEDKQREQELYLEIIARYLQVSDILANAGRSGSPFVSTTHAELPSVLAHAEWWWKCVLRAWAFRAAAVVTGALSLAVTVAEVTLSNRLPNLSVFASALHAVAGNETVSELLGFAFLAYPCLCTYFALFKLGRFSFYLLVPGHTGAFSLLANAGFTCRFAAPLAFNFMAALALPTKSGLVPDIKATVFHDEFGALMMRQPLLGVGFTTYAPLALLPYMGLLLWVGAFNRLAGIFVRGGASVWEDDYEMRSPAAAQGMRLMRVEVENHAAGRPPGLTLTDAGATNGDFLGPGGSKTGGWWRSLFGKRQEMSKEDHLGAASAAASPAQRTGPAAEARDRLARALGRTSEFGEEAASGRAASNKSSYLGSGGRGATSDSADERTLLVPSGGAARRGDLESIFARLEAQPEDRLVGGSTRRGREERETTSSLSFESDTERDESAGGGLGSWFRRKR